MAVDARGRSNTWECRTVGSAPVNGGSPWSSEVEDLRLAAVGDEDIVGFQVAVDDRVVVRDADGREELLDQVDGHVHAEPPVFVEPRPHRAPFDPLHDDEQHWAVLVEVVDPHDAGMIERRYGGGFAVEPLPEARVAGILLGQHLDGDGDLEARVGGPIDDSHRAAPELGFDRVAPELRGTQPENTSRSVCRTVRGSPPVEAVNLLLGVSSLLVSGRR